jgi:hypothetical protein
VVLHRFARDALELRVEGRPATCLQFVPRHDFAPFVVSSWDSR